MRQQALEETRAHFKADEKGSMGDREAKGTRRKGLFALRALGS